MHNMFSWALANNLNKHEICFSNEEMLELISDKTLSFGVPQRLNGDAVLMVCFCVLHALD